MNDHQCSSRCRREGCPNCPHGKGDEEHCDVCDKITKATETMNDEPLPLWVRILLGVVIIVALLGFLRGGAGDGTNAWFMMRGL